MPDEKKAPTTAEQNSTSDRREIKQVGTFSWSVQAWVYPERVYAIDSSYALTGNLGKNDESKTLLANDFQFSIPGSATILGVEVRIRSYASVAGKIVTHGLGLTKGGSANSESRADFNCDHPWSTSVGYHHSGGGPTDLWGFGLNASQVNSPSFGVLFAVENCASGNAIPYVDAIEVEVWYDDGAGSTSAGVHLPHYADNVP